MPEDVKAIAIPGARAPVDAAPRALGAARARRGRRGGSARDACRRRRRKTRCAQRDDAARLAAGRLVRRARSVRPLRRARRRPCRARRSGCAVRARGGRRRRARARSASSRRRSRSTRSARSRAKRSTCRSSSRRRQGLTGSTSSCRCRRSCAFPRAIRARVALTAERTLDVAVVCDRWGAFAVGPVVLRARDRLGFHSWEAQIGAARPLRVYPSVETLRTMLAPLETQVFIGNQTSRTKGDGIEFADIRGLGSRRPRAQHQLARDRAARRPARQPAASGAEHRRRAVPRHVHRRRHRQPRHARHDGPRRDVARASIPRAQGPRRRRELRRLSLVAPPRVGNAAALPDRRLAPADGHRAELREKGHRHPAAADAAAESARARAVAAPRRAVGRPRSSICVRAASTSS